MLKFCAIIATITTFGILYALPLKAQNVLSNCYESAIMLDLASEICNGELSESAQSKVAKLTDINTLSHFGILLRQLGRLKTARLVLDIALLNDPRNQSIRLSLANLSEAEYKSIVSGVAESYNAARRINANNVGAEKAQLAFSQYQALQGELKTPTQIRSGLNEIRLWTELESSIPAIKTLKESTKPNILIVARTINNRFSEGLLSNDELIEFRLHLVESLLKSEEEVLINGIAAHQIEMLLRAINPNTEPRSFSKALGAQGTLSFRQSNIENAIKSYKLALGTALAINAPELAYQWEFALGKIYRKQGDKKISREFYKSAEAHIETLKAGQLTFATDIQYQYSSVEFTPVYREYLDLLFSEKSPDLKEIISIFERIKRNELENYLQCGNLKLVYLSQLSKEKSPGIILYFLRGKDTYEIIIRTKQNIFKRISVKAKPLEEILLKTRQYLASRPLYTTTDKEFQELMLQLYDKSFASFETSLPKNESIVLVLDDELQNIPWGGLYRRGRFFIEDYPISYSYGSEFQDFNTPNRKPKKIFAGGISDKQIQSKALPEVKTELMGIKNIFPDTKVYLNADFTKEVLLTKSNQASIIHLASHGQFSSSPEKTYIENWDGRLVLNDLQNLVEKRFSIPLDLLFLSACESAQGDIRTTLGIAGSAYRAGAGAAIATLWPVEDDPMAKLTLNFYEGLKTGKSKTEALRDAQIKAIHSNNRNQSHFTNWAGLILLGSWK